MDIVRAIRNLRAEKQVKPGQKLPAMLACGNDLELIGCSGAGDRGPGRSGA